MRALLVAMSAIVLLLCLSSASRADVKITVTYTTIEHEVSPNNAIHKNEHKRELILTSDHKIQSTNEYAGRSSTDVRTLGNKYKGKSFSGMPYNSRWSIEKGAIVFLSSSESYLFTLRISTDGIDTCSASVQFKLKNGRQLFEVRRISNHEDMNLDDIHAENFACAITTVNY
jgi:hypothetical protein